MLDKFIRMFRGVSSGHGDSDDQFSEATFLLCLGKLPMRALEGTLVGGRCGSGNNSNCKIVLYRWCHLQMRTRYTVQASCGCSSRIEFQASRDQKSSGQSETKIWTAPT